MVFRVSGGEESASQCLEAAALATLGGFGGLHGRVRIADQTPLTVAVKAELVFHGDAGCTGAVLGAASSAEISGDSGGVWQSLGIETSIPAEALSVTAVFRAIPQDPATDSDVELDRTSLGTGSLFADGFESGDTAAGASPSPDAPSEPRGPSRGSFFFPARPVPGLPVLTPRTAKTGFPPSRE